MRVDVLTTFPELFKAESPAALGSSIPRRAIDAGMLEVHATNIRHFAQNKHDKTDDRPFGGGPGMVMTAQPLRDAARHAESQDPRPFRRVLLSPQGVPLTQRLVEQLATERRLVLICGHYEGIDERAIEALSPLEISLGDYVLSGGELGALVLIDALARLQPGVLGDTESAIQDSFSTVPTTNPNGEAIPPGLLERLGIPANARLLDCPHYTRPRVWDGREVPDALLSGDHNAVAAWRLERMLERTRSRRPDLLDDS